MTTNSAVQPNAAQVAAPDGQMGSGIDFLTDTDAGVYQLVENRTDIVRRIDGQDIKGFVADPEPGTDLHGRTGVGQHPIERRGEIAEGLGRRRAMHEPLVGLVTGQEVFAQKRVPVGEEGAAVRGVEAADVGVVGSREGSFLPATGVIGRLGDADAADNLRETVMSQPGLATILAYRHAGGRRKEGTKGMLRGVTADVAGIVALVADKVQQEFGIGCIQSGYPKGQTGMALRRECAAEVGQQGLDREEPDDLGKHGERAAGIAAGLKDADEQVDGTLLDGGERLTVAFGIVQTDDGEVPDVGDGDGKGTAGVERLHVEHQAAPPTETGEIAFTSLQRTVQNLDDFVGFTGLGVESIVGIGPLEDDGLLGVVLVEILEKADLLLGNGQERGLASGLPPAVVQNGAFGIMAVHEADQCLLGGKDKHIAGKQRGVRILAPAIRIDRGTRGTIDLEDVRDFRLVLPQQSGQLLLLMGQGANHEPLELHPIELVGTKGTDSPVCSLYV